MIAGLAVAEAVIVLLLLWMLLAGQSAAQTALAAENAQLKATLVALPVPTATPCQYRELTRLCHP